MTVEQGDQAPDLNLLVRCELDPSPGPVNGGGQVAALLVAPRHCPRRPCCRVPQPAALGFEPPFELRRIRDEEPFQQIPAVEIERFPEGVISDGFLERGDIAPDVGEVEPDLFVAPTGEGLRPEGGAEDVQRLAQSRARVLLIELRPKEREQTVAAVKTAGCRGGEEGEEGEAPGLAEEIPHLASLDAGETHPADQAELDHARPLRTRDAVQSPSSMARAVTAGVTVASQTRDALPIDWRRSRKLVRGLVRGNHKSRGCLMRATTAKRAVLVVFSTLTLACNLDRPALGPARPAVDRQLEQSSSPLVEHIVAPQATDAAIDQGLDDHYVWLDTTARSNHKLFVFLPGTGQNPSIFQLVQQEAARLGYHVIGLMYPTGGGLAKACPTTPDPSSCYENARLEIIDGLDRVPFLNVNVANSIDNRLTKLLQYLTRQYPDE